MFEKAKQLFSGNNRAVSPVIGVILMVAVTVVLAAVIGGFVFGLGDPAEPAPNAQIEAEYVPSSDQVFLSNAGGDVIEGNNAVLTADHDGPSAAADTDILYFDQASLGTADGSQKTLVLDQDIRAGDSIVTYENVSSGDTVTLEWQSEDGSQATTLGEFTAP